MKTVWESVDIIYIQKSNITRLSREIYVFESGMVSLCVVVDSLLVMGEARPRKQHVLLRESPVDGKV